MKKLLILLFLTTIIFQPLTSADDISEFELDSLSIGDSLLDIFSSKTIEDNKAKYYKDNTFASMSFSSLDKKYDEIQVSWKTSDPKYKIMSIAAGINQTSMNECYKKMKKVSNELVQFFDKKPKKQESHPNPFGLYTYIVIPFDNGDEVSISCYDYEDKYEYTDIFRINIDSKEFRNWIDSDPFKKK